MESGTFFEQNACAPGHSPPPQRHHLNIAAAAIWSSSASERPALLLLGMADEAALRNLRGRARAPHPRDAVGSGSIWFGGNVSRYYDSLLAGEKRKLRPQQIETLAVHRWLGARRSTTEHYKLVHSALARLPRAARVMDAGCGVGGAMLWLEQREPAWQLVGHTVSEEQHGWAERVCKQKVPPCRFTVQLRSYDAPMGSFNAIYSIEALIHSPDVGATLQAWSRHLEPGGAVAVIDDFLADHPPPTVLREPEIWPPSDRAGSQSGCARRRGSPLPPQPRGCGSWRTATSARSTRSSRGTTAPSRRSCPTKASGRVTRDGSAPSREES